MRTPNPHKGRSTGGLEQKISNKFKKIKAAAQYQKPLHFPWTKYTELHKDMQTSYICTHSSHKLFALFLSVWGLIPKTLC